MESSYICNEKIISSEQKNYEDVGDFQLLGYSYPIKINIDTELKKASVIFQEDYLEINLIEYDEAMVKTMLTRFYKKRCKRIVESRIKIHQSNFKMKPKTIKISLNNKNWGTCNSMRELTFNWRLAMAPIEVIDYVVIHEMCHMVHMNHDRSFWRLVGKYMRDYEYKQEWLKQSYWKMMV
jgi:predicted metal-dependent hydrolase